MVRIAASQCVPVRYRLKRNSFATFTSRSLRDMAASSCFKEERHSVVKLSYSSVGINPSLYCLIVEDDGTVRSRSGSFYGGSELATSRQTSRYTLNQLQMLINSRELAAIKAPPSAFASAYDNAGYITYGSGGYFGRSELQVRTARGVQTFSVGDDADIPPILRQILDLLYKL